MLQSLLVQRFGLRVHFATSDMPSYDLVIDRAGRLPAPNDDAGNSAPTSSGWVLNPTGEFIFHNLKLEELLQSSLFGLGDRPIVNKTGLSGTYNLKLRWKPQRTATPISSSAFDGTVPTTEDEDVSIFTAIREQLGLRLVPSHSELEVVDVDHIDPPSEN
jgi:uncharacterized protein (TIGR03435 family)